MLKEIYRDIKVRAVCSELGMPDEIARTMIHISCGNLDEIIKHGLPEWITIDQALGRYARFKDEKGLMGDEIRSMKHLLEDPQYRIDMARLYFEQVQPRVNQMGFGDLVKVIRATRHKAKQGKL